MKRITKKMAGVCGLAWLLLLGGCMEIDFDVSVLHPDGRYDRAMKDLEAAGSERERFYALNDAAKTAFEMGRFDDARQYAEELLELAPTYPKDWNYGNAIHDGNMVLGRLALREGESDRAKDFLLEAGRTKGSPQLNSFGPNMSLARDLIESGERDAVLEYFELCRVFWSMGNRDLNRWSRQVRDGKTPGFGANLLY
jgi:tetratricopeptide (TPR) repeat protein